MAGKFNDCANGATPFPLESNGQKGRMRLTDDFPCLQSVLAMSCFQCFDAAAW